MEVIQDKLQKNSDRLRMEVIQDELQKNGVHVDVQTLDIYLYDILVTYKPMYDGAKSRLKSNYLIDVFHENCFNTVGRVMAYLTLVRCMRYGVGEETVRKAARLAAVSLLNITRIDGALSLRDAPIPDEVFIRTLCSSIGYTPMDTT